MRWDCGQAMTLGLLVGLVATCPADLELIPGRAKMVGDTKWQEVNAPSIPGVKWQNAWNLGASKRLIGSVYVGRHNRVLAGTELKALMRAVVNALLPPNGRKTISSEDGIGPKSDPVRNAGGSYLFQINDQYGRVLVCLAQHQKTLVFVSTMFQPNDKEAGVRAAKIMGSFRFDGKKVLTVNIKK